VLCSDHGNLEDVSGGHTLNPVFSLFHGPHALGLRDGMTRITDLHSRILRALARPSEPDEASPAGR
jgi:hypothetical protein